MYGKATTSRFASPRVVVLALMTPSITSPVSRFVGTSDIERLSGFYRDILGFEVRRKGREVEAVKGPARLQFGEHDFPPDSWSDPLPPGAAWIYFETNDVAAMRETILKNGGQPSPVGKLNWVKLKAFEIRDPDGRTLIF